MPTCKCQRHNPTKRPPHEEAPLTYRDAQARKQARIIREAYEDAHNLGVAAKRVEVDDDHYDQPFCARSNDRVGFACAREHGMVYEWPAIPWSDTFERLPEPTRTNRVGDFSTAMIGVTFLRATPLHGPLPTANYVAIGEPPVTERRMPSRETVERDMAAPLDEDSTRCIYLTFRPAT